MKTRGIMTKQGVHIYVTDSDNDGKILFVSDEMTVLLTGEELIAVADLLTYPNEPAELEKEGAPKLSRRGKFQVSGDTYRNLHSAWEFIEANVTAIISVTPAGNDRFIVEAICDQFDEIDLANETVPYYNVAIFKTNEDGTRKLQFKRIGE